MWYIWVVGHTPPILRCWGYQTTRIVHDDDNERAPKNCKRYKQPQGSSDARILQVRGSVRTRVARAELFKKSSVNLVAALPVGGFPAQRSLRSKVGKQSWMSRQQADNRQSSNPSTTPPHYPTSCRPRQLPTTVTQLLPDPW